MSRSEPPDHLETLLRFSRAVSSTNRPQEVVVHLLAAVIASVNADAAVVVEVRDDGLLHVAGCSGVDAARLAEPISEDTLGPALGEEIRRRADVEGQRTIMMASGGDLYGALVLLSRGAPLVTKDLRLAEALADIAGGALGQVARIEELDRNNQELRASREVLKRSAKLRALGEMAAGVSHDLKNILNPISLYAQVAKRALDKGDPKGAAGAIGEVQDMVRRGVETIDRLREFSRQEPTTPEQEVSLEPIVNEAVKLARARLATRREGTVSISVALGASGRVRVQPADLMSALVNLVLNAIDAMPKGGRVAVETVAEAGGVTIRVADDGPGMPPEVESRVFEPFFTTKGADGTGLGLAMVYAFAQRSGGSVKLETALGQGTTFSIWLPVVAS